MCDRIAKIGNMFPKKVNLGRFDPFRGFVLVGPYEVP